MWLLNKEVNFFCYRARKELIREQIEKQLTVVADLEVRVTVPVQDGVVMGRCMRYSRRRCRHWTILAFHIGSEVKCYHTVGWTSGIVAGDVELRSREGHDVLRNYARVELRKQ